MEKIGSLRVLNDDQENRKLVSKLPKWASNRWSRQAFHWKEEKETFPPFSEFVKFVVKEADIACDPVLSSPAPTEEDSSRITNDRNKPFRPRPPRRRPHDANTFATSSNDEHKGTTENSLLQLSTSLVSSVRSLTTWTNVPNSLKGPSAKERHLLRPRDSASAACSVVICPRIVKKGRSVAFATDSIPLHFMVTSEGAKKTPVTNRIQTRYRRQAAPRPAL